MGEAAAGEGGVEGEIAQGGEARAGGKFATAVAGERKTKCANQWCLIPSGRVGVR